MTPWLAAVGIDESHFLLMIFFLWEEAGDAQLSEWGIFYFSKYFIFCTFIQFFILYRMSMIYDWLLPFLT